jgi:hypothetical protein
MDLPCHGVVVIETLRRYWRVPVGTRATGEFAFWVRPGEPPHHQEFQVRVRVGDDPRPVTVDCLADFTSNRTWPMPVMRMYRKAYQTYVAADLSAYLLQTVTDALENLSTGTGAQRFRVIEVEWRNELPLPAWVPKSVRCGTPDSSGT